MGQLPNTPAWGFLVKAPVEQVREILASFGEDFIFRTNHGWTAAFYMEPGDGGDSEAAERLRSLGFVPIYWFDFNKYEFLTLRWDGERWTDDKDPGVVLGAVGLQAPYWDNLPDAVKPEPVESREALVVEGASVEQARALAGDRWRIEPGPLGAIVYGSEGGPYDLRVAMMFNDTRFAFWDHAPGRVFEIEFYPKSGSFWFRVMKGEECLGTFRPGQTRTWDGTPFLASVEGETEPEAIVEKLGIPRSFLART
jgi:hypothetical protein